MDASISATGSEVMHLLDDFFAQKPTHPLIVVLGPTASGKTGFSIRLIHTLKNRGIPAEIVNADSRQFYRHLDIGTAKISSQEMQGVPHHLLSVLDPKEPCSIAWFQEHASRVVDDMYMRGVVPVLVGGSMLYISAFIDGFQPIPPEEGIRKSLSDAYDADDGVTLMKRLHDVDPVSAAGIPRQNKVYLVRALEIYETTGKPKSAQQVKAGSRYDVLMLGMHRAKEDLHASIDQRTRAMLASGWIEEVRLLRAQGYTSQDPAMESVGYREICSALDRGDLDPEKLATDIARKTRRYAKSSMTWWRRDPRIHWIKT